MTTREHNPVGAPCWADLWTSDVEGSRRFYSELLGWEALPGDPQFGGYFMWARHGAAVAGGMGDMADMKATNTWRVYLATDDMEKTLKETEANGGQVVAGAMPVGDAGTQAVLVDSVGANLGAWQAKQFPGFTVLDEPGAPNWFELLTRHHDRAVDFYRSVFHWETHMVGDTDDFRYTVMRDPATGSWLAGIMDAAGFLPEGAPSQWSVYWEVEDVDATLARAGALGGSVVQPAEDTPYGRLAALADPAGAHFKLRSSVNN